VKTITIPTGTKSIPATAVIPGHAVAREEITNVLNVSTSEIALKEVSSDAEEITGSDQAEILTETTADPRMINRTPRIRRIRIEERARAAVTAKPASPNALRPGAAT
jgi:hypothetical protein